MPQYSQILDAGLGPRGQLSVSIFTFRIPKKEPRADAATCHGVSVVGGSPREWLTLEVAGDAKSRPQESISAITREAIPNPPHRQACGH